MRHKQLHIWLTILCLCGLAGWNSAAQAQEPLSNPRPSARPATDTQTTTLDSLHANYLRRREETCVDAAILTCKLYGVSIAELLAHPGLFHGKRVRVVGFLRLEFEGTAVYASREDEAQRLHRNGLWVDFLNKAVSDRADAVNNRYVLLEGTFDAEFTGHMGLWSGAIRDIYRVIAWR